ncbi:MAG: ATP-binding cassette domain-containing protein [Planctomycetota bacterium]
MTTPAVQAEGVRFAYSKSFGLEIDAFEAVPGEPTAIVGPSGCGKTTLLRLLTGVLLPADGMVTLLGTDLSTCSAAERRSLRLSSVGMVFQSFALMPYLSALDNILLPYRLSPRVPHRADAAPRARELARSLGVDHALRRKPARLSQGERQRIAICRALVTRPRLIVCDEPTGNLDPTRSRDTLDLVLREADAIDAAVIVVTHDHSLLAAFPRTLDMAQTRPNLTGPTSAGTDADHTRRGAGATA